MFKIHVYADPRPGLKGKDRVLETCLWCGGTGEYYGKTSYTREPIQTDGQFRLGAGCFACEGKGGKMILVSSVRARVRRNVEEFNREGRFNAGLDSDLALAWGKKNPVEFGILKTMRGDFADSLTKRLATTGELTEKQIAALAKVSVKVEETKGQVPTGRVTITGEVVSTKWVESDYGDMFKFLIKTAENFKVYGTVPRDLWEVEKGDMVTFTATVTPSKDDPSFGFFKRPTKSSVVK